MKPLLKKILPESLKAAIRKRRSRFHKMPPKEVFASIYDSAYWKATESDSVSGPGSSMEATAGLRAALANWMQKHQINRIGDVGCGDFLWMREVLAPHQSYTGYEIVPALVQANTRAFSTENVQFRELNLIAQVPQTADLLICRDCLVHLDLPAVRLALQNLVASGASYVALTHFPDHSKNISIATGNWRRLNFCASPFLFPAPDFILQDHPQEKHLAIWKLTRLQKLPLFHA